MSYSPLRISASKSSIVILHSDIIRLLFKKVRVKKNNQNNYEFYLNLTSKTASNVWISVKGNFLIKTSEVFLMFYKLIYSRFIGLLESFNPKNK